MRARPDIAPGAILQRMYIRRRLRTWQHNPGKFYEFGSGNGHLSRLFLESGYTGIGFDLNASACANNANWNAPFVESGRYSIRNESFLDYRSDGGAVDLVVSSMVLEHLEDSEVERYFQKCHELLRPSGLLLTLVPANPSLWSIEDDIAGHRRRYMQRDFFPLAKRHGYSVQHVAGLTYPLSNMLLPVSNYLVARAERHKLLLGMEQRTVESGDRLVPFKTVFPAFMSLLANPVTLMPFHLLQMCFRRCARAPIIYCEMKPL